MAEIKKKPLTQEKVIADFLRNDLTPRELARFYDREYYVGRISSDAISSILSNPNLSFEVRKKISDKEKQLREGLAKKKKVTSTEDVYRLLDQELRKLVITTSSINQDNIMILRCVCLYVSDYNYAEISRLLYLSKSTVSKYINKALSLGILNGVTQKLLEERLKANERFNPKQVNDEIIRVIRSFIDNKGNYQKTVEETGISNRTLTRYLSNSKLEAIIGSEMYSEVRALVNLMVTERASKAYTASVRANNIRAELAKVKTESKSKKLIELLLLENIRDFNELVKLSSLSPYYVRNFLKLDAEIEHTYGELIYQEFLKVRDDVVMPKEEIEDTSDTLYLMDLFLRSRYSQSGFCAEHRITSGHLKEYFISKKDDIDPAIWEDLFNSFIEHASFTETIYRRCPRDKRVVDRADLVRLIDNEVVYVNDTEYKMLNILSHYMECEGNLMEVATKYNINYPYAFNTLSSTSLQSLLNEDTLTRLQTYLKFEMIISDGKNLTTKRNLIRDVVDSLYGNGYNVEKILNEYGMPIEVLTRLLKDEMVSQLFPTEAIAKLFKVISLYQETTIQEDSKQK